MKLSKFILVSGLLLSGTTLTAETLSPGALNTHLKAADLAHQIETIRSYQANELIQKGQQLLTGETDSIVVKERLLMAVIRTASGMEPTPELVAFTRQLSSYEPQVEVMLTDGGHRHKMQAFPIAGHAHAMLTDWRYRAAISDMLPDGQLDIKQVTQFLNEPHTPDADHIWSRMLHRLNKTDLEILETNTDLSKLSDIQVVDLANATGSMTTFDVLIERINSATTGIAAIHHTLQSLDRTYGAFVAKDVLLAIDDSSPYAATAIYSLSKMDRGDSQLQQHFIDLLPHPQLGGDAAIALGPRLNVAIIDQLEQNLNSKDKYLQRRSALALKSSGDPLARQILEDFARNNKDLQFVQELIK